MFKSKIYGLRDILLIPIAINPALSVSYFLVTFIQSLFSTVMIVYATSYFIETATKVLNTELAVEVIYTSLAYLLGIFAGGNLLEHLLNLLEVRIKISLETRLEPYLLERRSSLHYRYIEDADTWDLVERLTEDMVVNLLDGNKAFAIIFRNVAALLSILLFLLSQVWWAALMIAILSIPLFWFSMKIGTKNYDAWIEAWPYERRYSYYSDDILTSREATQERSLFNYTDYVVEEYKKHFENARKIQQQNYLKSRIATTSTGLLMTILAFFILVFLINKIQHDFLNSGTYIGITTSVFTLAATVGGSLQDSMKRISYAKNCMDDLNSFLQLELQEGALTVPDKDVPVFETLAFQNVYFKYPHANNYTLKNLSFQLEAGKHYAFVGRNGSGKTTIIKLILRLYDQYEGTILLNGKNLKSYPLSTLKSMFSVVFQDFAKYQISIEDNILLGNVPISVKTRDVEHVVKRVGFESDLKVLPKGLETHVGKLSPDGIDLSGGQWQKIAMARSFISSAPIKILDEPTAALDPLVESRIYQDFETMTSGKTTIFISHRLGSTKIADEILVIDGGSIFERGSHKELMELKGLYNEMFESQRRWYE
ncbi:ABC transporter ATP-binding protein [Streptococcus suis]|uniref:ABC transporter ATP-binding protein n=1 Tax=Streptococcus suis TaxID=1307 RepID=UPI0004198A24|nr:ABC transporter ATP-binding protein [Streptococcus suis]